MRKIWFFYFLLIQGCNQNDGNQANFFAVDPHFLYGVSSGENVSVYGFLAKKNGIVFLYSDEKATVFKGPESNMFRIQVWYPEEKINSECLNKYVVVHGKKQEYIGAPAVDEIILISNLEHDNLECHPPGEVINYFEKKRRSAKAGR